MWGVVWRISSSCERLRLGHIAHRAVVGVARRYWRQFSLWLGSVHASRRDITEVLEQRQLSVTTFMDGIHGMFAGGWGPSKPIARCCRPRQLAPPQAKLDPSLVKQ